MKYSSVITACKNRSAANFLVCGNFPRKHKVAFRSVIKIFKQLTTSLHYVSRIFQYIYNEASYKQSLVKSEKR